MDAFLHQVLSEPLHMQLPNRQTGELGRFHSVSLFLDHLHSAELQVELADGVERKELQLLSKHEIIEYCKNVLKISN